MNIPARTPTFGAGLALWLVAHSTLNAAGQNRDQQAAGDMLRASREVVRTAPTDADRIETEHVVLYIDKGLLSA